MCRECRKYKCPWNCPNFRAELDFSDEVERECENCGERLPKSLLYRIGNESYCEDCIMDMRVGEVLRISEIGGVENFTAALRGRLTVCL